MSAVPARRDESPEEAQAEVRREVRLGEGEAARPVRVRVEGEELEWHPGESLVATLMAQYFGRRGRGAFMGCREGGCGACKLELLEGVVALRRNYSKDVLEDEERERGFFLACRARPITDITVRFVPRRNVFFELYGRRLREKEEQRAAVGEGSGTQPEEVSHG